jgi:CBS domain-containing protein
MGLWPPTPSPADGTISGLITLNQLCGVRSAQRATTSVGDVALPLDRVPTARTAEPVTALIERLEPTAGRRVLVMDDGGQVVGIVTVSDIARLVEVRMLALPRSVA